jgi:hypothetical protein
VNLLQRQDLALRFARRLGFQPERAASTSLAPREGLTVRVVCAGDIAFDVSGADMVDQLRHEERQDAARLGLEARTRDVRRSQLGLPETTFRPRGLGVDQ